ncbi:MAG: hypothetical protein QM790_07415 [Nibricoccus sp.]
MANFRKNIVLAALIFSACSGPSITKTTVNPPDPRAKEYETFVARRTDELVKSGACKNSDEAGRQARVEADRRFGPITAEYTTTTTWGPAAKKELQKAEIESGLDKMKREQTNPRPNN